MSNVTKPSVSDLKALAYDLIAQIQSAQAKLQQVNQAIAASLQDASVINPPPPVNAVEQQPTTNTF